MNRFMVIMIVVLQVMAHSACSKMNDQYAKPGQLRIDTVTFAHSMKGWELYSWQQGNTWKYSFLVGTNRLKSYDEVMKNNIAVTGTDSLKMLLDRFPPKEYITWIGKQWLHDIWGSGYGNLSLPGAATVNDIKAYCENRNLYLFVTE